MNHSVIDQTGITTTREFLRRHAPFDLMSPAHVEFLAKRLRLAFYARGEAITSPEQGPANRLFIIKQGRVRGEVGEDSPSSGSAWELVTGESFPIGALLSRRAVHTINRAVEDSFCYELDRQDFEALIQQSPVFQDFCTRRIASLLDNALRDVQAHSATRVSESNSLSTPLSDLIQREPVTCAPETTIAEVLRLMDRERIGSMVVVDPQHRPIGVFTLHDVLSRIALPRRDPAGPISQVMTRNPITISPEAHAYEAALLMAQHGFGHICVADKGHLVGVVSERDLFSLQRVGLVNLSRAINHADSIEVLAKLGVSVHRLVDQMLAQGASVMQITEIITSLNDNITQRAIAMVLSETGKPTVDFTWLAFGSEGRREQTLYTDQDNGILFDVPEGRTEESVRAELLPIAHRINEALAQCGFPLCLGNVMARNPQWCLSQSEWQDKFADWIHRGDMPELLNATIFFDFRAIYGAEGPVLELQQWLLNKVRDQRMFLRRMTENALAKQPPLGVVRDFVVTSGGEHPHTIDLKINGITPFVDAARIFALTAGVTATNTVERLRSAGAQWRLDMSDVEGWIGAFQFIQLLRLRQQHEQGRRGEELSNHVDPYALNELEQRILKESFRQARKLQGLLEQYYKF